MHHLGWFEKILATFQDWNSLQLQRLFSFDHALSFFSIASGIIACLIFVLLSQQSWPRLRRKLKAHLSSLRFRRELALDLKFFALRWVHFPLCIALIGGSAVFSHKEVSSWLSSLLAPVLFWEKIELDSIHGPAALVFFTALVIDFSSYISHRVMHAVPFLWEFHKTHHRARYLTPLTKYRIHPMDDILDASIQAVVIGILMLVFNLVFFVPDVAPVIGGVGVFYVSHWLTLHLNHSHVRMSFGPWLERVFLSPVLHQIHHGRAAKYHDKNFGVVFSFWDRIFGTFYAPQKNEKWVIGIEESYDVNNLRLSQELSKPFRDILRSVLIETRPAPRAGEGALSDPTSNRQAGFTLVETLVAAALSSILAIIGVVILIGSVRSDLQMVAKIDTSAKLEQGLALLSKMAQLGLEVRPTPRLPPGMPASTAGEGYVRQNFTYSQFRDLRQPQTELMYFSRENRFLPKLATGMAPTSATAVFFQAPTQTTPGAVYIDSGRGIGTETLAMDNSDFRIENVVGVSLRNPSVNAATGLLERIEFSITVRFFIESIPKGNRVARWCPAPDRRQCPTLSKFKDITRTVVLDFANNRRVQAGVSSRPAFEYPHGFYLFRSQILK